MNKIMTLLLMFLILTACGTSGDSSQRSSDITEENTPVSEENEVDNSPADDSKESSDPIKSKEEARKKLETNELNKEELEVQVDRQDENFLFKVTNNKEEDAEIYFSSGQEYDYVVYDDSGSAVKKLSEGMMYTQAIKEMILAPGDALEYPISYRDLAADLPPGEYTIQFIFTDANHHATAKETFTVE
ncbi:hypothetical protein FZC76_06295 [Sutcliffiella horikoshii]|uniref:Intracellular proteinase inhibitor BsuPI domain-containing protein n=1 Tax=Sutcliffiella horikoshii TaxID=79883 RepID=A0A5D4T365_9BACI|nr:BsuPI-related putative proteinase inhibitor [Sutcliffiella horikoshii]TYS69835.1 hypothetical protein FZC76_06295 [Sutcliffiella horikoshii]